MKPGPGSSRCTGNPPRTDRAEPPLSDRPTGAGCTEAGRPEEATRRRSTAEARGLRGLTRLRTTETGTGRSGRTAAGPGRPTTATATRTAAPRPAGGSRRPALGATEPGTSGPEPRRGRWVSPGNRGCSCRGWSCWSCWVWVVTGWTPGGLGQNLLDTVRSETDNYRCFDRFVLLL